MDHPKGRSAGMTVNERLVVTGLMDAYETAITAGDREEAVAVLVKSGFPRASAEYTADATLARAAFYGYPRSHDG